jgi:LAS superfamily LD-carboxypeptidase LdcB
VQRAVNQVLGLQLTEDGIAGPATRSAIRSFQQKHGGLAVDGVVGAQTEAALIAAGASPPPSGESPVAPGAPGGTPDIVSVNGIQVARQIAPNLAALLAAAASAGVSLSGWGYRSIARQIELRKQNCGTSDYDVYQKPSSQCSPPTAPPGRSMHEQGLAVDFTYRGSSIKTRDNPGFLWLAANAGRFGFKNLPSEPWHWSTNGH